MNKRAHTALGAAIRAENRRQQLIPVLLVAGSSLVSAPALALELGEAQVASTLGQPLRVSIPYALGPEEALDSSCVSVRRGVSASGLPAVSRADVGVANGRITITGDGIVREPLMALAVNIRCPYTAQLTREYMLFIDPAEPAKTAATPPAGAAQPAPAASLPAAPRPSARPAAAPRTAAIARAAIQTGTRYRVQPGDSLSSIAQRIDNRSVGLWDAVGRIFDANPAAFIDRDPNKLMAGTWLTIPDLVTLDGAAAVVFPPAAENRPQSTTGAPATTMPSPATATAPAAVAPVTLSEPIRAPNLSPAPPPVDAALEATAESSAATVDAVDGAPEDAADPAATDDVTTAGDNPFVTPGAETTLIPDTELAGPETRAAAPNVPTATVRTRVEEPASGGWVGWLLGGAVALVGGLLLIGRRVRDTFGSTPIALAQGPQHRRTDPGARELKAVQETRAQPVEPPADDSPTHENPALDADLVMGTGLSDGADVEMVYDFGIAAATRVDIELPEEMSSGGVSDTVDTDIIPPVTAHLESILESEVLPEYDDEDENEYDMSVIVDATKMPRPEDVTERDFAAIEIDDDARDESEYTVDREADFQMLEQDYEDEFTATQTLKEEIARAAAELAASLDEDQDDAGSGDTTAEMGLASVTTIEEATARLGRDEVESPGDLDDTGVSEAVTAKLPADDKTVEMPSAEGDDTDVTAKMPAKRGTRSG